MRFNQRPEGVPATSDLKCDRNHLTQYKPAPNRRIFGLHFRGSSVLWEISNVDVVSLTVFVESATFLRTLIHRIGTLCPTHIDKPVARAHSLSYHQSA